MHSPSTATTRAAEKIIAAARRLLSQRTAPILIALDGPSGSGKSALAGRVAEALDATVVPSDDFFAAEISDAEWEMRSPRDRAAGGLDWRRLEGAYSARPELTDLIDLAVLVDAPVPLRQTRLAAREGTSFLEVWHRRWDAAEAHYFTHVRPPSSFELVVSTA